MADRFDFGEFVSRLMRDAEANFPLLAPIRIDRDQRRDVWRVITRRGEFMVSDQIPANRRQLVEFFVYNLAELQRRAEYEERHQLRMALHVGDVITVNGHETRIVAIRPNEITVERPDPREVAGRCDCRSCREREANAVAIGYDALRYGTFAPAIRQAPITREAEARSMELLRRNLTPEQTRQWDRNRTIDVHGQSGALYRIRGEIGAYNIDRVGHGRLCCTPGNPGELPLGDYVLGQKLALEHDEERFLSEANFMGGDLARELRAEPGRVMYVDEARRPAVATNRDLEQLFRETYIGGLPGF